MPKRRSGEVDWTPERVEVLKKLWGAGLTAKAIAEDFGDVSRNAVIGKVNRLGLERRRSETDDTERVPYIAPPRAGKSPVQKRIASPSVVPDYPKGKTEAKKKQVPVVELVIPTSMKISLLDLNKGNCHWPSGHPGSDDFSFCGNTSLTGLPYCAWHCRTGYRYAARSVSRKTRAA